MGDAARSGGGFGVALLAAGSSRRFGARDKLAAPFRGRKLGEWAARAVPVEMFAHRWVIVSSPRHVCAQAWRETGWDPVVNPQAEEGIGSSVACAARHAQSAGCEALLITLADMPLVPCEHFAALVKAFDEEAGIVASQAGEGPPQPPAIFAAHHLPALALLDGDSGARGLLSRARTIACPREWLTDIDTRAALRHHGQDRPVDPNARKKGDHT